MYLRRPGQSAPEERSLSASRFVSTRLLIADDGGIGWTEAPVPTRIARAAHKPTSDGGSITWQP